jgi:hypothetical protein
VVPIPNPLLVAFCGGALTALFVMLPMVLKLVILAGMAAGLLITYPLWLSLRKGLELPGSGGKKGDS